MRSYPKVEIRKPVKRMRTVIRQLERCLFYCDCEGCWLGHVNSCKDFLMVDGLYYLEQLLEKSEKKGKTK